MLQLWNIARITHALVLGVIFIITDAKYRQKLAKTLASGLELVMPAKAERLTKNER